MSLGVSVKRGLRLFRRFRRQSPARRRLLLRAVWTLLYVRAALWVVPSRVVLRRINAMVPDEGSAQSGAGSDGVRKVILAVESAGRRLPWASTCLTQALAAQALLARAGYRSTLKIGVARGAEGAFKAHAWLEHQGRVVIGDLDLGQYTLMPDLRSAL
jgi:hypothetical protein